MSKFLMQLSWTEQGIRDIKNFAKRAQDGRSGSEVSLAKAGGFAH